MHTAFKTVEWARASNIYEVNVRQYTSAGTFNAFAKHLPRLKDMGVQILWFMPIHPIGVVKRLGSLGSYYSIKDYKAVNPEFGNLDDFKRLVNTAHTMGFKVIIDWVANHTSWDHVWTQEHRDYFELDGHGNFKCPYDWHDVIQIDHTSAAQQDAMIDAMKFWLQECDLDGFRCDMAHLIPLNFWFKARTALDAIKPLFWLAETEAPAYHEVFDATYTWEFLHKMEQFWRRETDIGGLDAVLNRYRNDFPNDSIRAFFTSNHDENSHSGSEYERIGDAVKVFAVLCGVWNGVPLIYSGQELPNKKRLKFFDKDEIEWTAHVELHEFYKKILQLHSTHPALKAGDDTVSNERLHTSDGRIFCINRKKDDQGVLALLNLSADTISFSIPEEKIAGVYRDIFSGDTNFINPGISIEMNAWAFKVLEK